MHFGTGMGWLGWEDPCSPPLFFLIFKECFCRFQQQQQLEFVSTGGGREWLRGVCLSSKPTVEVLFSLFLYNKVKNKGLTAVWSLESMKVEGPR